MRFTIRHLLLVFLAYQLAIFLGGVQDWGIRTIWRHTSAAFEIRCIMMASAYHDKTILAQIPSDVLDKWLAGNLNEKERAKHGLEDFPVLDPWGRPYRYVRDMTLPDRAVVDFGVYSLGEDGKSTSNGNDPDDISSWVPYPDNVAYYSQKVRTEYRWERAIRGAYLTPFVYIGIVGIVWLFKRCRTRRPTMDGGKAAAPSPH